MALFFSKLLFFATFGLSSLVRTVVVACQIVSVILHVVLLLSFSLTVLFGLKVMSMMIKIKYDMATMANNKNKEGTIHWGEAARYFGVVAVVVILGIATAVVEFALGKSVFGYGVNGMCFVTERQAILYSVVVPISLAVGMNVVSTITSVALLWSITQEEHSFLTASTILGSFCRLISFQSLQWIFGLVYFIDFNLVVSYIFSVLSSFEGAFIYFVVYSTSSKG